MHSDERSAYNWPRVNTWTARDGVDRRGFAIVTPIRTNPTGQPADGPPRRSATVTPNADTPERADGAPATAEQLARAVPLLAAIAAASAEIVWTTDADGMTGDPDELRGLNGRFWSDFTGQTHDEIRGLGWLDAIHPEDRAVAVAAWRTGIAGGEPFESQYRVRRRDGEYRRLLDRAVPVRDDSGEIVRWVGTCLDITDRKRFEDEWRLQAGLLDQAYNANFAWEWGGGIIFWNQGAERLYGYSREEALGRISHDLLRTAHPLPVAEIMAALKRDGQWHGEVEHTRRDGTRILVESRHQLLAIGGRRLVLEANRDITERHRVEEERARFQERIRLSEERLRIALHGSPIVVYQQDRDLRYTWLYNFPQVEDVLGKTDAQLLPPQEAAELIALKRRVLETGAIERREVRATTSHGTVYYDLTVEPVRDDTGAIVGVTGSAVDLTGRRDREERIARLQDLTAALAGAVDADAVARAIVDHGIGAVGANLGIVAVVSGDGQSLISRAVGGIDEDAADTLRRVPLDAPTAIADAVRRREPIYLESRRERTARYPRSARVRAIGGDGAAVALPLLVEGRPIGVLGLGFPADRTFDDETRDFLRALADLCAQALERARLYDAERQARDAAQEAERRLALLVEISGNLASSLDYEDTIARVPRLVVPALADWCAVNLASSDGTPELVALAAADPAEEARLRAYAAEAPVSRDASYGVAHVLRTGVPLFAPVIATADGDEAGDCAAARSRALGLASYVCVPLVARDRIRGSLTFAMSGSGRRYRKEDLALAEEIARRAAAAIDNAGLFRAARQEIAERERAANRTARLQDVTAALSEAVTVDQVVDVALSGAVPATGAQGGTMTLLSAGGTAFETVGSTGMPRRLVEDWRRYPVVGPFPLSEAARTAQPVWIERPADWADRYPESYDDFVASGFQSLASVPLVIEGRLLGGIGFDFISPHAFDPDERAFIVAISQQVAQALDRARLYEAEREARASAEAAEARYRGLFERSADAVLVVDRRGRFRDANPAALDVLGYTHEELLTLTLTDLTTAHAPSVESVFDALAAEGAWHGEFDIRQKGGDLVLVEARATEIQIPTGTAAMFAARDISVRRRLERMQQDFFASVSHDLKNPLAALRGQVQLLHRRVRRKQFLEAAEVEAGLETIQSVGERMTAMIDELVDVAQLRGGNPLRLRRQPTDLVELATRRVREHQQATTRHTIRLESPEPTLTGWWDEARLGRVIDNLLTNAVKYSLGGEIAVRLRRESRAGGDWAVMTIADQGVGIPAADLPLVFERFRRGSNVLDRFAGTGLGLSGVRQIVVQHGGDVAIASTEGVGTTVTVALPLGEPPEASGDQED